MAFIVKKYENRNPDGFELLKEAKAMGKIELEKI